MQVWMKITQCLMIFIRAWVTSSQCWVDFMQPLPIFVRGFTGISFGLDQGVMSLALRRGGRRRAMAWRNHASNWCEAAAPAWPNWRRLW